MNRFFLRAALLGLALCTGAAWAEPSPPLKTLRYAFRIAETGFDPAQTTDLYSATLIAHILEAPLTYDYLARPARIKPQTAAALPTVSDDHKTWTVRIRPGIFFAEDPAFGGQRRELTAQDYVYSIKRHYDPKFKSGRLYLFEGAGLLGLSALRKEALATKKPFDYDREVDGLRALDRYTLQFRFDKPQPRFDQVLADGAITGAVAREVMQAYAGREMEHPVGTGPFRLARWQRSAKIVMERNPGFREQFYDESPSPNDPRSVAIAAQLKGRRLPMVDRVEVTIIDEDQPRWLSFLNGEYDMIERLANEFAVIAVPNGQLAPRLERQGLQVDRMPAVDVTYMYFAMEHPVIGGYTPHQVALRRAIGLAYRADDEVRLVRKAQAIPAQGVIPPQTSGYDPALKTEMSEHDPARARALLDLYGYIDRNGDGWRDLPDGRPLLLQIAGQPDQTNRQIQELWKKSLTEVGIRAEFQIAKFPEHIKASRAGKLMMWSLAWNGPMPNGDYFLGLGYGPNKGQANHPRFDLPAFNELFERQAVLPDGPERDRLMREASLLLTAYMPYKFTSHRIDTDLMHPWLQGYRRHPFMRDFWRYVDIDSARLTAAR